MTALFSAPSALCSDAHRMGNPAQLTETGIMGNKQPTCEVIDDGESVFVVIDGIRVAQRGEPGTRYAKTWVSIEPGWVMFDVGADKRSISVTYSGASVH
jgi:hypothetical protein